MFLLMQWKLIGAGAGIVLSIFGAVLGWGIFPPMVDEKVAEKVILVEGSEQYDRWMTLPQPLSFKVYLFNVTNVAEVQNGGRPKVREVGPYIYKQYREKRNVAFSADSTTASYTQRQHFTFDKVASAPLTEHDKITVLNIYMNSILQIVDREIKNRYKKVSNRVNTTLGRIPVIRQVKRILENANIAKKNASDDGLYRVDTGREDPVKTLDIREWENSATLSFWNNEENGGASTCNMINGTDASSYPPFRKPEGSMFIYSSDICRSVEVFFDHKTEYAGIPGLRFSTRENFVTNIGPEHANGCFCVNKIPKAIAQDNGCLYPGAMDLSNCLGAPIVLTEPHMLGASSVYTSLLDGLKPNAGKHRTFVDVEPYTGSPLRGGKRVQFNMFLRQIDGITLSENLKNTLMPVLWVEEGIELNDEMVQTIKDSLINVLTVLKAIYWTMIALGLLMFVAFTTWYYVEKKKSVVKIV